MPCSPRCTAGGQATSDVDGRRSSRRRRRRTAAPRSTSTSSRPRPTCTTPSTEHSGDGRDGVVLPVIARVGAATTSSDASKWSPIARSCSSKRGRRSDRSASGRRVLVGELHAVVDGHGPVPGTQPSAHVEVAVDGLSSGNSVYDAELRRRIDARRFPTATLDLRELQDRPRARALSARRRPHVPRGDAARSTAPCRRRSTRREARSSRGEQAIDIRDFGIPSPTVLMLRFYPDVRVRLHVEADPVEEAG